MLSVELNKWIEVYVGKDDSYSTVLVSTIVAETYI